MAVYLPYYIWLGLSSETILAQEDIRKSKQVVSPKISENYSLEWLLTGRARNGMLSYQWCLHFSTIKKMQICPENMEIRHEKERQRKESRRTNENHRHSSVITVNASSSSLSLAWVVSTTPTPARECTQTHKPTLPQTGTQNGAEQRGKERSSNTKVSPWDINKKKKKSCQKPFCWTTIPSLTPVFNAFQCQCAHLLSCSFYPE